MKHCQASPMPLAFLWVSPAVPQWHSPVAPAHGPTPPHAPVTPKAPPAKLPFWANSWAKLRGPGAGQQPLAPWGWRRCARWACRDWRAPPQATPRPSRPAAARRWVPARRGLPPSAPAPRKPWQLGEMSRVQGEEEGWKKKTIPAGFGPPFGW